MAAVLLAKRRDVYIPQRKTFEDRRSRALWSLCATFILDLKERGSASHFHSFQNFGSFSLLLWCCWRGNGEGKEVGYSDPFYKPCRKQRLLIIVSPQPSHSPTSRGQKLGRSISSHWYARVLHQIEQRASFVENMRSQFSLWVWNLSFVSKIEKLVTHYWLLARAYNPATSKNRVQIFCFSTLRLLGLPRNIFMEISRVLC